MKNLWIVTLISFLFFSCSTNQKEKSQKNTSTNNFYKSIPFLSDPGEDCIDATDANLDSIFDDKGNYIGYYKIGQPYGIKGKTYIPKEYKTYHETGMASWYGSDFHGKKTANGENYNSESITAAHRTLPLPSMVRVTNLKNGKSVIARVNDRGPFSKKRLIDLSEKAANLLNFRSQGTAEVKVELLQDETNELLKKLKIK